VLRTGTTVGGICVRMSGSPVQRLLWCALMKGRAAGHHLPPLVLEATTAASAAGFSCSCSESTGRLLTALAAIHADGLIGESGTGFGVGTAWLAAGLGPAGRLVTVEVDPDRSAAARRVLAADPRIEVLSGDWSQLAGYGPFDLLFCDGGGKRDDPQAVIDLLAVGGILVLDDFTPSPVWPPLYQGAPDVLRMRYLCAPELVATHVQVSPEEACIIATRRPG
jgi:predicted O-methyltransferase YrrM